MRVLAFYSTRDPWGVRMTWLTCRSSGGTRGVHGVERGDCLASVPLGNWQQNYQTPCIYILYIYYIQGVRHRPLHFSYAGRGRVSKRARSCLLRYSRARCRLWVVGGRISPTARIWQ